MHKLRELVLLISSLFLLINCSSSPTVCKTSNTVGLWKNSISKKMGGYLISQDTELEIKRYGPGDYEYFLNQTVVDQMYGGKPRYINSRGSFNNQIRDKKWRFDGGDLGEKGGFIEVPGDCWDNYKPERLIVSFQSGRGNSMIFTKY